MPLAESLFSQLSAEGSATAAIVGTNEAARIYPFTAPVNTPLPYIAWQTIAAPPDLTLGEKAASGTHLIQFSCVAGTYMEARDLGDAAIADLDNETLAALEVVLSCAPGDGFSEATDQFIRLVEASIFVPSAA